MVKMDRPRRIRFVIALTIGLSSLVVCFVSAHWVATSMMTSVEESLNSANSVAEVKEALDDVFGDPGPAGYVGDVAFIVAVLCFIYCFVLCAASFIGPRDGASINRSTSDSG